MKLVQSLATALMLSAGLLTGSLVEASHPPYGHSKHAQNQGPYHRLHSSKQPGVYPSYSRHDQFARHYAHRAVIQVQTAARYGHKSSSSRWSPYYEDHYYWALKVGPERAQRELRQRARRLARLHGYGDRVPYH